MRVLHCYRFLIGTKIPFDQWPGIVEKYLCQQKLAYRIFHYYLESFDQSAQFRSILNGTKCKACGAAEFGCHQCRKEAEGSLRKGTACQRALKENPFLGPIQTRQTQYATIQSLHNLDAESADSKEDVYAILPKLYKRYGFSETSLIYRDIDFFSQHTPTPALTAESFMNGYEGSGITLYRSCISQDNAIVLVIESCHPGEVLDTKPYADALGEMLPGIKRLSATKIIMDNEEQIRYEALCQQAKPLTNQAKAFFTEHMPDEKGNDAPKRPVSIASQLKKYGNRYGYTYLGYTDFIYSLEKKLSNGHYVCLEFVSAPSSSGADPIVSLCGLGFKHEIWADGFHPQNPQDATDYFSRLFEVLSQAEKSAFPAILDLYPQTPGWFIPAH